MVQFLFLRRIGGPASPARTPLVHLFTARGGGPKEQFFTPNPNVLWRVNPESNPLAVDRQNPHRCSVTDDNGLSDPSAQNKHGSSSLMGPLESR
jgi:hypothetical protein